MHDCHVHSIFSHDCKFSMDEMIEKSIEKRLKTIYFADHFELIKNSNINFEFDLKEYWKEVKKYSVKYKNNIDILCGLELGVGKEDIDLVEDKIKDVPIDMIILSIHRVDDEFFNNGAFFKGRQTLDIYEDYYNCTLDVINSFEDFDILGHIDILDNYSDYIIEKIAFEKYSYLVKIVLKRLVELNKGLEINTSIYEKNEEQILIQLKILQMYKKLGGEIITIGSDAKSPNNVGFGYDKAVEVAKKAGFEHICIYRKRLPNLIKI